MKLIFLFLFFGVCVEVFELTTSKKDMNQVEGGSTTGPMDSLSISIGYDLFVNYINSLQF